MPPKTESTTLSVSDLPDEASARDAPSASRTEVCARREAPRASRRLAMLAHAMSSTSEQTASRMCRLSA